MSNNQNRPSAPQPPQQNRDAREQDTRESAYRVETWAPPDVLPEIVKMPGYEYRWVRTAAMGDDDPTNISRSYREGWSPVAPEEQAHMSPFNDSRAAQRGSIEVGGLILCKCPTKLMKQRDEYYQTRARNEQKAIDENLMRENDARMPLFKERKSKTTFGNG